MDIGTIAFILALFIAIIIHEWGHYATAKRLGMKVTSFSIGVGPALYRTTGKDGTIFAFRLFPIAGGVTIPHMDTYSARTNVMVASAGPLTNIVFSVVIAMGLTIATWMYGTSDLVAITSKAWTSLIQTPVAFVRTIHNLVTIPFTPEYWVSLFQNGSMIKVNHVLKSAHTGDMNEFLAATHTVFIINLVLGVVNLVPLPPLDGGRIMMAGLKKLFNPSWGKRIEEVLIIGGIAYIIGLLILPGIIADIWVGVKMLLH